MEYRARDGTIIDALKNGGILHIDEWSLLPGEIQTRFHELLDANRRMSLAQLTGEMVKALPDLFLVTSFNPVEIGTENARKRLIRGRFIQGMVVASIYVACRQCNVIRTLEEVGMAANMSKKESGRNYRFLLRSLETRVPPVETKSYVSKFVNQLRLSGNVENIAMKILDQAMEIRLTCGRGPAGIAAAATYIASLLADERCTQGEIAKGAQVTEVTIRNRYKELIRKLAIEMIL